MLAGLKLAMVIKDGYQAPVSPIQRSASTEPMGLPVLVFG
jgi:hypothetical protein